MDDQGLTALLTDLGGHDLDVIVSAFAEADGVGDRPVAILAWTLKGWRLPFAGDPLNHGAQVTADQLAALRRDLGISEADEWGPFPGESEEGQGHQPELPVIVAVEDVTQAGGGGNAGQAEQDQHDGRQAAQSSHQGRERGKNEDALAIASGCAPLHQMYAPWQHP